jgi:hypothetical protein
MKLTDQIKLILQSNPDVKSWSDLKPLLPEDINYRNANKQYNRIINPKTLSDEEKTLRSERFKEWKLNNPDYTKNYRKENKEYLTQQRKNYYDKNQNTIKSKTLQKLYGITLDDYNILLHEQNECCKICGIHQSKLKKSLSVDHCHVTGKVCGLLCSYCNRAIGYLQEDYNVAMKAAEYVSTYKTKKSGK